MAPVGSDPFKYLLGPTRLLLMVTVSYAGTTTIIPAVDRNIVPEV